MSDSRKISTFVVTKIAREDSVNMKLSIRCIQSKNFGTDEKLKFMEHWMIRYLMYELHENVSKNRVLWSDWRKTEILEHNKQYYMTKMRIPHTM